MERELYRRLYVMIYQLARAQRTKHVVYADRLIVLVYAWAVLHDRPVNWACDKRHWPERARAQMRLPSASTMSRRLARPPVRALIDRFEATLRQRLQRGGPHRLDGKPLPVGGASKDRDAGQGFGAGRIIRGYKLHAITDKNGVFVAWRVRSANESEPRVARELIAHLPGPGLLLADNNYDRNHLYQCAGERRWLLVAARRKDARGFGHRRHSVYRLVAHQRIPEATRRRLLAQRRCIERHFAQLGNGAGGLGPLPMFVRSLPRVRRWVQVKIILHYLRRLIREDRLA